MAAVATTVVDQYQLEEAEKVPVPPSPALRTRLSLTFW